MVGVRLDEQTNTTQSVERNGMEVTLRWAFETVWSSFPLTLYYLKVVRRVAETEDDG